MELAKFGIHMGIPSPSIELKFFLLLDWLFFQFIILTMAGVAQRIHYRNSAHNLTTTASHDAPMAINLNRQNVWESVVF